MKTKIFGGIAIVAIAIAVAFNVTLSNQKQDAASLLALANVEALAQSGEEWEIICSLGDKGYCFADGMWLCMQGETVCYSCEFTGSKNDMCWCPC